VEQAIRERAELSGQLDPQPTPPKEPKLRPPGLMELESLLSDRLATKVAVQMGSKRGRVVIDFANLEDLERIYRIINE